MADRTVECVYCHRAVPTGQGCNAIQSLGCTNMIAFSRPEQLKTTPPLSDAAIAAFGRAMMEENAEE